MAASGGQNLLAGSQSHSFEDSGSDRWERFEASPTVAISSPEFKYCFNLELTVEPT
jgi:hypothetical protein